MSDVDLEPSTMSISLSLSAHSGLELRNDRLKPFQHFIQLFGIMSGNGIRAQLGLPDVDLNPRSRLGENHVGVQTERTEAAELKVIKDTTEAIAWDIVLVDFNSQTPRTAPNKFCRTMRRTVKDMLERHEIVFKGMVNKLNLDENNFFQTFVIVSDELFADGEVNWGRIVAVYAFAKRLAQHHNDNMKASQSETLHQEKIAMFLGKYVACKLGQWIHTHGGWDAFVEIFPDHKEFEEKMWKGLMFTAIGFVALGTMMASR
ncbi:hypothetical protein EGW08_014770 [Elysia chlorotica]|uniref:Bcl-2 Bcl-2 homology region 1-3 domain-containing protein n=1 Tax=Elysia chlorotica TaxID=188477 RepID=A0A433T7M4_ELYCH|nr:hypothetical protein EGW08_014770 [Elysia chlorotica]